MPRTTFAILLISVIALAAVTFSGITTVASAQGAAATDQQPQQLMQEYRQKERSAESAEDLDDAEDQTVSTPNDTRKPDDQEVIQTSERRENHSSRAEVTTAKGSGTEQSDNDEPESAVPISTFVPKPTQPSYDQDLTAALEAFSAETITKAPPPAPQKKLKADTSNPLNDQKNQTLSSGIHHKPKTFSFGLYFPRTFIGAEPQWVSGQSRALQLKNVFDTLGLSFPPEPSGQQFAARV
mgnify:CR=1 FL=1